MKPLLGAVLIVKDEAKTIEKTIASLGERPFVLDTGSTDGTQGILRRLDVDFVEEPFIDYATSRNRALALAAEHNPTVFTLSLSADETLVGGELLRAFLDAHRDSSEGSYCIMMRTGNRQWPFPRILRTGGGWKYENSAGLRHEQPVGPNNESVGPLILGVFVVHEESDPERKFSRLRDADLPDLTAVVNDESKSLSERLEPMFQLAETHFVLGQHEQNECVGDKMRNLDGKWLSHFFASMALYTRYAGIAEAFSAKMKELGEADWQHLFQRAMYAQLMYLQVAETFGLFEPTELVKRLHMVTSLAPQLPEAHWALARNAAKVDVRKAIALAMRSAKVAKLVYDHPVHGPVDTTLEWQSYLLAAECSRVIKDKRMQAHFTKQALAAGASREVVGDLAGLVSVS